MRYLKAFCLAALVLAAFGVSAVAANAESSLPTFLLLKEEKFELKSANATAKTTFTGIQNLKGVGYLFELFGEEMSELGEADLLFDGVELGGKKCKTSGDPAGEVLIPGAEWHGVLDLSGNILLLILLPAAGVKLECEGVNITVTGSQLSKVTTATNKEVTTFEGETGKCTGSTPAFGEYDSMIPSMLKAELKSETGGIKAKSCEEIEGKISFAASHDAEIMDP